MVSIFGIRCEVTCSSFLESRASPNEQLSSPSPNEHQPESDELLIWEFAARSGFNSKPDSEPVLYRRPVELEYRVSNRYRVFKYKTAYGAPYGTAIPRGYIRADNDTAEYSTGPYRPDFGPVRDPSGRKKNPRPGRSGSGEFRPADVTRPRGLPSGPVRGVPATVRVRRERVVSARVPVRPDPDDFDGPIFGPDFVRDCG